MNNYLSNRHNHFGFVDPFFDEFFSRQSANEIMRTDIKDKGDHYLLKIDVPDLKKDYLKIYLQEGYLTINANFVEENEQKNDDGKYLRKERKYGSYSRSFYVGENIKQKDIKAKLENGVLTLNIAKVAFDKRNENHLIDID